MANIYSGMTSAQKDNERKYLNSLVSGGGGNAEWAKNQLKDLDAASTSSSSKGTSSGSSKGSSSNYETWESGGRTYVNGIDIGPAGTKVDLSTSNAYETASKNYNNKNTYAEEEDYNPYKEQLEKLKNEYAKQEELLREQNRLAVEQGTNRLEAQKSNITQSADENARQAYVQYMQSQKALPQQLASQGATGGATETANLGLQTAYQNNVNSINQNKANRLQEIDNAIVDLKNTGDLSMVEQVLANNQLALDAYTSAFDKGMSYNQWATEFNANRQDVAADQAYRDKVYADNMAQQELENQWYERNYSDSKKQEETNRVISLLENGLVDVNYASTLLGVPVNQINNFVNYINKARNLELSNTQSLINSRNEEKTTKNETSSSTINSIINTVTKMLNEREDVFGDGSIYRNVYGPEDAKAYVLSQNSSDEEQYNILSNFGLI